MIISFNAIAATIPVPYSVSQMKCISTQPKMLPKMLCNLSNVPLYSVVTPWQRIANEKPSET